METSTWLQQRNVPGREEHSRFPFLHHAAPQALKLAEGAAWSTHSPRAGLVIGCESGKLWVTVEGARIAQSLGISSGDLARVLERCSADTYAMRRLIGGVDPQLLVTASRPFLAKDVAVVRTVADSIGLDLGMLGDLARWVEDPA